MRWSICFSALVAMVHNGFVAAAVQDSPQTTSTPAFTNFTSPGPTTTIPTPPNIPSITLPGLPPSFNDIPPAILSCYDAWASARAHNAFIKAQVTSLATTVKLNSPRTGFYTTTYVDNPSCVTSAVTAQYITLCDGHPRNTETTEPASSCRTETHTYNTSSVDSQTTIIPSWLSSWRASNTVPVPTCTLAADRENLCYRLHSAYHWRSEQLESSARATPNITRLPAGAISAEKPRCQTISRPLPANQTTRDCRIKVDAYQLYYWPSAPLTGSSFCVPNATRLPGGTPTIPFHPNTAVISGLTLTSPSVYHFLKGVGISTSIGAVKQGRYALSPVYNQSTYIPPDTILTFPQEETDIWTVRSHKTGRGIHAHRDYEYRRGSYNADDMATVRADAYFGPCTSKSGKGCNHTGEVISQAYFVQRAALQVKDVLEEFDSDEFKECDWTGQNYEAAFHDRPGMWIAPGKPSVATAIVTNAGDGPEETSRARPGGGASGSSGAGPSRTATAEGDWDPEVTGTGTPDPEEDDDE